MNCCIKVTNPENDANIALQLSADEFTRVKEYIGRSRSTINVLCATLKPIRTNNCKNFAKDFFLPTVVNHAIKIDNLSVKIFALPVAFLLDVVTFPIRLVTCVPRAISNTRQEEYIFKTFLASKVGRGSPLLQTDHVKIKLEWEQQSALPTSFWTTKDGVKQSKCSLEKHWRAQYVNFIELPSYVDATTLASGIDHQ